MKPLKKICLLPALAVLVALGVSGCDQRSGTESVGQKVDRASDKMSAATSDAANKATEVLDDASITTKVKAAMLAEPGIRTLQIGVDTKDAVVTLSGTVDTPELKERAQQIAGSVAGVRSVDNRIVAAMKNNG